MPESRLQKMKLLQLDSIPKNNKLETQKYGDINNLEKTHKRVLNQGKLRDVFNEIKKDLKP
jgi:hypothetical protein